MKDLLTHYLHGFENDTLTHDERLKLADFFIQNNSIAPCEFSDDQIQQYIILGWYISTFLK